MINSSQRQLLQLLAIQPLQLKSCFQPEPETTPADVVADTATGPTLLCPQENHPLVQDVVYLLRQQPDTTPQGLQLGSLYWSILPGSTECTLSGHQLISPELSYLTSSALKRQLWACLSHYLDAND
ncbi:hypothetical protein ABC502_18355 [Alkalimonas sp. NCh-2]|uniref:hypothetical protein n=1 Tax=Alkalimonas sp. NCh-2 TaxID=3144846 RepID=UPI0031F6B0C0